MQYSVVSSEISASPSGVPGIGNRKLIGRASGREVYFKGEEKKLLSVVDSIFASGYLTADGQGIKDTIRTITDAGFTYEIESA